VASIKGRNRTPMPRSRDKEPNRKRPEGQLSLYLDHLLRKRGKSADDLADAIGVSRATVFNWLRGDSSPPVRLWDKIAAFLSLKDWRALLPPERFVDSL